MKLSAGRSAKLRTSTSWRQPGQQHQTFPLSSSSTVADNSPSLRYADFRRNLVFSQAIPASHVLATRSTMGRYDFRPLRVHQTTTQLLNTERISTPPAWYNVVGSITPSQPLVRTQPLPHQRRKAPPKTKKASKLFQPQRISYEEDNLRREFFEDHPWELARPRLIIENDGRDSQKTDWSHVQQKEKKLSGER